MPFHHLVVDRSFIDIRTIEELEDSCGIAIDTFVNLILNHFSLANRALLRGDTSLYRFIIFRAIHGVKNQVFFIGIVAFFDDE